MAQQHQHQQRSVSFAAPVRTHNNNWDAPPVFSPTQVNVKESVLHSVFSPSNTRNERPVLPRSEWTAPDHSFDTLAMETSLVSPSNSASPTTMTMSDSGNQQPDRTAYSSSYRQVPTTAAANNTAMSTSVTPPAPRRTASPFFHSHHPNNNTAPLAVHVSPTSTISNDVFYSPQSSVEDNLISPANSEVTTKSTATFKSLRDVTLLDLEKIKTCESIDDLQNVIDVLNGEGKFQALLRKAKSRLQEILGGTNHAEKSPLFHHHNHKEQLSNYSPKPPTFSSSYQKRSPSNNNNIELDANTIVPTTQPFPKGLSILPPALSNQDLSPSSNAQNETNDSLVMSLASSMPDFYFEQQANRNTPTGLSVSPGSSSDFNVSKELKRLTETVLSMETARLADRKVFLEKLNTLEKTTGNGKEGHFKTIESIVEKSSQTTQELLTSLEQLRKESYELQTNVKKDREEWYKTYEAAKQLETRLCQKAEELTDRLVAGGGADQGAAFEEIQKQFETELLEKSRQNEHLSHVLRETQSKLSAGEKERNRILQEILVGSGRNKNELPLMDEAERKRLISGFSQKYLTLKAGTESLAKTAAELEKDRNQAYNEKRDIMTKLEDAKKSESKLERANVQLTSKIQRLSQELADMREQVTNNLKLAGTEKDWKAQEDKYKEIISTLKKQLRSSDTMVSVGLYRSAVSASKEKAKEVQEKETELHSLKQKCSNLETRVQEMVQLSQSQESSHEKRSQKRIAALESQLKSALEKAKQEAGKHQTALRELETARADLNLENAMDGASKLSLKTPGKKNQSSSQKVQQASGAGTKPQGGAAKNTPMKPTRGNSENYFTSPKTTMKLRREGFPKTAKELKQRVQKMRSPRAGALQSLSVNKQQ